MVHSTSAHGVAYASGPSRARALVVFGAAYALSLAAGFGQGMVPPVLPMIANSFGLSLAAAGAVASFFSISGTVLALPGGFVIARFGNRAVGLWAAAALGLGAAIGAVAPSFSMLLIGRAVAGIGFGLGVVAAPTAIANAFPPDRRGVPMGIWATWGPAGMSLAFVLGPYVAAGSWRALWWVAAVASCAIALLWAAVVPGADRGDASVRRDGSASPLGHRGLWLLGAGFFAFNSALVSLLTYLPTFLVSTGTTLTTASTASSIVLLAGLVTGPLSGWVLGRLRSRRAFTVLVLVLTAVVVPLPLLDAGFAIGRMLISGLVFGMVPPLFYSAVPELWPTSRAIAVGMGFLAVSQGLAGVVAPLAFGAIVDGPGWTWAAIGAGGAALAAAALMWSARTVARTESTRGHSVAGMVDA